STAGRASSGRGARIVWLTSSGNAGRRRPVERSLLRCFRLRRPRSGASSALRFVGIGVGDRGAGLQRFAPGLEHRADALADVDLRQRWPVAVLLLARGNLLAGIPERGDEVVVPVERFDQPGLAEVGHLRGGAAAEGGAVLAR